MPACWPNSSIEFTEFFFAHFVFKNVKNAEKNHFQQCLMSVCLGSETNDNSRMKSPIKFVLVLKYLRRTDKIWTF